MNIPGNYKTRSTPYGVLDGVPQKIAYLNRKIVDFVVLNAPNEIPNFFSITLSEF